MANKTVLACALCLGLALCASHACAGAAASSAPPTADIARPHTLSPSLSMADIAMLPPTINEPAPVTPTQRNHYIQAKKIIAQKPKQKIAPPAKADLQTPADSYTKSLMRKLALLEAEKEDLRQKLEATKTGNLANIGRCVTEDKRIEELSAKVSFLEQQNAALQKAQDEAADGAAAMASIGLPTPPIDIDAIMATGGAPYP